MYRSFLPVEPDEVRDIRPETAPPHPTSMRGRLIFTVVMIIGLVGVIFAFTLMRVRNPCTDEQQAAWDAIDHFVALQPGDGYELPGCSASFRTDARAGEVLDHYETALLAAGWTITTLDPPSPAMPLPTPMAGNGPMPEPVPALSGTLEAALGRLQITIAHDTAWDITDDGASYAPVGKVYVLLAGTE